MDLRFIPNSVQNADTVWENKNVKWELATGWSTDEILKNLLAPSTSLKNLAISANTLQSINPVASGLKPLNNQSSTIKGIS